MMAVSGCRISCAMLAANSPSALRRDLRLSSRPALQRGLREQAIGDIEAGADIAGKASIRFAARNARIQDPAILAVEPPHAELHAERFTRIESRSIGRQTGGEVVGVDAAGVEPSPSSCSSDRPVNASHGRLKKSHVLSAPDRQ